MITIKDFKENDVYEFRYKPEVHKKLFEPYHCFDGTLIVKKYNNTLLLEDTYWYTGDNTIFTLEKAIEEGDLTYLCNIDDMVDIKSHEMVYYDDVVILQIHNAYRNRYLIKKDAVRSQNKMIESIKDKIEAEQYKMSSAKSSLDSYYKLLTKVENGDTSVFI